VAIAIVPLAGEHDRSTFQSGSAALDRWFIERAGQDDRRDVARVFVAVDEHRRILGFYSIGAFTIAIEDFPEAMARKLPRYDLMPAALIGRLARHVDGKGRGLGTLLLGDAVRRIVTVNRSFAVQAIVVDAKDDAAAAFYKAFGFEPFPSRTNRLFMPMRTAEKALLAAIS
jgi:GNAT superfamily N-acetyltransferase